MNVLIDTNIILDILLRREPHYENAAKISVLSEKGHIYGYITASAVTDIFYITKKELKNKDLALDLLKGILTTIRIASVTERNIYEALDLKWDDFEDSVQYSVAYNISADYIVTRNPIDFYDSNINTLLPEQLLNLIIYTED